MWTQHFWIALAERALKTFCQSAAALLVGDGLGLVDVDWWRILSVAGLAMVVSGLSTIGTGAATDGYASVAKAEVVMTPSLTGDRR